MASVNSPETLQGCFYCTNFHPDDLAQRKDLLDRHAGPPPWMHGSCTAPVELKGAKIFEGSEVVEIHHRVEVGAQSPCIVYTGLARVQDPQTGREVWSGDFAFQPYQPR